MEKDIEQSFLQSPEWEQFQQSLGSETFRAGESLFVVHTLPIVGKYAYCPRGPVGKLKIKNEKLKIGEGAETGDSLLGRANVEMEEIIVEAKKRGCGWIRIEPNSEENWHSIQKEIGSLGFNFSFFIFHFSFSWRKAPRDVQPREILVMDIAKPEEELLAEMKSKTRYNIRLAEKKGVKVIVSKEAKYQERFVELVRETAERAGIRPHTKEHYLKMFETLGDSVELYNAEYDGKIIASNMMIFVGEGAIYLHGGSSNEHRNVMAPFLLQWRAMQDAKKRGCKWYDFGGVATSDPRPTTYDLRQRWGGITKFKQGFCPQTEATQFPGTWDVVLSPWRCWVYRMLQKIRW
jgi:lipid II:glycine glycyltransferase (peptidoglycan interpeptide bridge formation enzyme)